ncbi:MAG: hypothetical protein QW741_03105, partial [Sulfolobales archaeon]
GGDKDISSSLSERYSYTVGEYSALLRLITTRILVKTFGNLLVRGKTPGIEEWQLFNEGYLGIVDHVRGN